jgi:hypothetical protein
MSTVKNPKEKKILSLKHDRRNVFSECPTSSRKNIALGKQRSHQQARHSIAEVLSNQVGSSAEIDGDEIESTINNRAIISRRKSFKKMPDAPLGEVLYKRKIGYYPVSVGSNLTRAMLATLREKS